MEPLLHFQLRVLLLPWLLQLSHSCWQLLTPPSQFRTVTLMSGVTSRIFLLPPTLAVLLSACWTMFLSLPHHPPPPTPARLWGAGWQLSRMRVLCTGSRLSSQLLSPPLTTFLSRYQTFLLLPYLCKCLLPSFSINLNQVPFLILMMNSEILQYLQQDLLHH